MSKYRIVQRSFLRHDTVKTVEYIVCQYRPWWSPLWVDIKYFYEPEIEEMPGYWTEVCKTFEEAEDVISFHKHRYQLEAVAAYHINN